MIAARLLTQGLAWPELSHTGRAGTNGYLDVAKRPPYLSVWCWGGLPGGDWCWGWRGRGGVGWQLMATWVTICEGTTPRRAVQGAPGPGACGRAAGLQFGGAGWSIWVHALARHKLLGNWDIPGDLAGPKYLRLKRPCPRANPGFRGALGPRLSLWLWLATFQAFLRPGQRLEHDQVDLAPETS